MRTLIHVQQVPFRGRIAEEFLPINTNLRNQLQAVVWAQSSMAARDTPCLSGFPNPVLTSASQAALKSTEARCM